MNEQTERSLGREQGGHRVFYLSAIFFKK